MARQPPVPDGVRLNRFLACCGLGSRRKCEAFILEGKVEINGAIVTGLGARVFPDDHVRCEGRRLTPEKEITLLLNKPKGFLCSREDPEGRETIYELLPRRFRRLQYVGRLDRDSEGLLLLTNSGDLNVLLTHPKHQVEKEYSVILDRAFGPGVIPQLLSGIPLVEGLARAKSVRPVSRRRLSMVLTQGYNRQIRRMFAKLGYKVKSLERVRIGNLVAPDLSPGDYRVLNSREIQRASGELEK